MGAVILSSELDAKSRQNAVLQFNKGKYDVLIANDQADIDEEIAEGENEKVTFKTLTLIREFLGPSPSALSGKKSKNQASDVTLAT